MKSGLKIETILTHGKYEVLRVTDRRFGSWKYGLFYNRQWREWSYDFTELRDKAYANK